MFLDSGSRRVDLERVDDVGPPEGVPRNAVGAAWSRTGFVGAPSPARVGLPSRTSVWVSGVSIRLASTPPVWWWPVGVTTESCGCVGAVPDLQTRPLVTIPLQSGATRLVVVPFPPPEPRKLLKITGIGTLRPLFAPHVPVSSIMGLFRLPVTGVTVSLAGRDSRDYYGRCVARGLAPARRSHVRPCRTYLA
jgi:hypothetical protein